MADDQASEKAWIEKTFEFEDDTAEHSLGSHWQPFFESPEIIFKQLPEILEKALLQISELDCKTTRRALPENWPKAFNYVWPTRMYGVSATTIVSDKGNFLVSLFPFYRLGSQHEVVIERVHVWESCVEAQIECSLGGAIVTFFDIDYVTYRTRYEAGMAYEFILIGFAYSCRKAEDQVFQALNPKLTEAFRTERPDIAADWPEGDTIPVHTKGMAVFIPVKEWDRDDFSFRGPVREIEEITMLDQLAWKLTVTVLRDVYEDPRDVDMSVIVTRKIWGDSLPPQICDDVEGSLWLQGYYLRTLKSD